MTMTNAGSSLWRFGNSARAAPHFAGHLSGRDEDRERGDGLRRGLHGHSWAQRCRRPVEEVGGTTRSSPPVGNVAVGRWGGWHRVRSRQLHLRRFRSRRFGAGGCGTVRTVGCGAPERRSSRRVGSRRGRRSVVSQPGSRTRTWSTEFSLRKQVRHGASPRVPGCAARTRLGHSSPRRGQEWVSSA